VGAPVRLAVAGAGLMGKRHVAAIGAVAEARLAAIVDPSAGAQQYAGGLGVPWFPCLEQSIAAGVADGVIVATPNHMHVENALECVAAGLPALVEKPICVEVASAGRLVAAAEAAGVALLVGHHRRHNPLIAAAKGEIERGAIGRIVAVQGMAWLYKPDDYFETAWRRQPGAGPVFINLIHDIDLLRHLCGEIVAVQALESHGVRGNPVEDSAAILLSFENGALGTVTVSDTVVGPWSWELTAGENPDYPKTDEACYLIGGTEGSLELPKARIWRYPGVRSWWQPMDTCKVGSEPADPLVRQMAHFCAIVRDGIEPLVCGREGLRTLRVVEAVKIAARTGETIRLAEG